MNDHHKELKLKVSKRQIYDDLDEMYPVLKERAKRYPDNDKAVSSWLSLCQMLLEQPEVKDWRKKEHRHCHGHGGCRNEH